MKPSDFTDIDSEIQSISSSLFSCAVLCLLFEETKQRIIWNENMIKNHKKGPIKGQRKIF